jgi:hypothetical protein
MTDNCKIISVTAQQPVVTIPNGAKVATAEAKEIITKVESVQLAPPSPDVCYESVLTGLGEEWIPDPKLFKYLENEFSLNEYFKKTFIKVIRDNSNTSDVRFARVVKILSDSIGHSDTFNRVWNAFRTYNDSITHTELLRLHPFKVVSDSTTNFEQLNYTVKKGLVDSTHMVDLTKILIQVSTGKFETAHVSDSFSRIVNYVRQLNDLVHTTDDFYGAANIDDDQYALVYKVILDFVDTHETFGVRFTKAPILDVVTKSDTLSLHYKKPEQDNANIRHDLPIFVNNLVKNDSVIKSDTNSKVIDKAPFIESLTSSDVLANNLTKPFIESIINADLQFSTISPLKEEIISNIEQIVIDLATTILDQSTIAEEIAKAMSKMTETDSTATSETLFKKDIAILIKEEDYFLSDYFFEDYFFRAVHTADQITDVQFRKQINDIVDATDDFYGSLNVDDDQTASVSKVLVDWASIGETFSRVVQYYRTILDTLSNSEVINKVLSKKVNDTSTITETTYKIVEKIFTDSKTFVDIASKLTNKGLIDVTSNSELTVFAASKLITDTINKTETVAKATSKTLTDVSVVSELFSRVFVAFRTFTDTFTYSDNALIRIGKNNVETVGVSEYYYLVTSKTLSETVNRSEVKLFNFSKQLSDLVDATDDFYGNANIDDDQTAAVTKVFADYTTTNDLFNRVVQYVRSYTDGSVVSEIVNKSYSKQLTETVTRSDLVTKVDAKVVNDQASTSQSLTIYNQNYYASNYMVPGYYGEMYSY